MRTKHGLGLVCLTVLSLLLTACWIPLPEETAIVVKVLESANPVNQPVSADDVKPVEGVVVLIDGGGASTDAQGNIFRSFDASGDHLVQVDAGSLIDPQGGRRWVLAGSHISGERRGAAVIYEPLPAGRQFAVIDTSLVVPVEKGSITVVTIYLQEMLVSPMDNQWLTDGSDPDSPYRSGNGSFEYLDTPQPTFWWRQEPSILGTAGTPLDFNFQLWEDDDGDTRYPLGVVNTVDYAAVTNSTSPTYIAPEAGPGPSGCGPVRPPVLCSTMSTTRPPRCGITGSGRTTPF
jgi:hypothetical protein